MIGHQIHRRALFVLAVWAAIALLAACGDSRKKSTLPATDSGQLAAVAGLGTCATCHTVAAAEWLASGHANLGPTGTLDSAGNPTLSQIGAAGCAACHDPNGDSARLVAGYTGNTARPVVGCEACHGDGSLHAGAGGTGPIGFASKRDGSIGATVVSAQFNTCTACHELLDSAGTGTTAAAAHDAGGSDPRVVPEGVSSNKNSITDTHFASGGTYTLTGRNLSNKPAGYAMDYSSEKVCSNCHNPHGTAEIARDWVNGPHGNAGRSSSTHFPWTDFNWSCQTEIAGCGLTPGTGDVPRPFCQRCHTMTGYTAYNKANASGDRQLVSDIWNGLVPLLDYDPNWNAETLECAGCHTDNRGGIRNPGAYNAIYGYRTSATPSLSTGTQVIQAYATFQYPDASSSNVCILCHSGRNSGATIKALNTAQAGTTATVDFRFLRASTPHFRIAAGLMFTASGYEYDGRDYTNPASYMHDKVGTPAVPNSGTGGPCVGCHMYRTAATPNHRFTNISSIGSKVTTTTLVTLVSGTTTSVVNIVSTTTNTTTSISSAVCFQCHAGSSESLGEILENEKAALEAASQALNTQLTFKGLPQASVNWLSRTPAYATADTDVTGNTTGKNNMGASFNFDLMRESRQSAAYVHNSKYAKRLLYDSIDWVDNNTMDYSVGATLQAICSKPTPSTWCADGMPYLLPNGIATGAPAERPY